jgi:hypothetical protein
MGEQGGSGGGTVQKPIEYVEWLDQQPVFPLVVDHSLPGFPDTESENRLPQVLPRRTKPFCEYTPLEIQKIIDLAG